jgi:hypothetical protein
MEESISQFRPAGLEESIQSPVKVANPRLDAALRLARYGFRVFPLQPNAKVPAIQNWRKLANVDEGLICQWWVKEFPNANIGLVTDGLCVIDIDPRNGGEALGTR